MWNPYYKKALIRLLLSIPILFILFGSSALSFLVTWSRLSSPGWTDTFAMLEQNIGHIECCSAFLLMCIHYPIYLRGFIDLRRRLPGTDTLFAFATLSAFSIGILPRVLDWTAGFFLLSPLYASTMSALLSFGAIGEEFPSYFHLVGLWTFFTSLGDFLRARAAILLARSAGLDKPMSEDDLSISLVQFPGHAAILSLIFSILCGVAWVLLGVSVPFAVGFSLFLLLSAAPCALPLVEAVPLWIGAALLGENGASLRSIRAIESAATADTLVLGKSDVLTRGEPQITDIIPEGITVSALMSLAAAAESGSRHPIARAISEYAIRLRAKYGRIAAFNESPGEGVEVLMNNAPIRVGQRTWIESQGVRISANLLTKDDQLAEKGKTILYVSNGKNAKGIIAYEYDLDEETSETVISLEQQGVSTILMIGEGSRTAKALAKRLGIPNYRHDIKTEDLIREIQLLQTQGKNVALFANLPEDSEPMKQADCPILPRLEKAAEPPDLPWQNITTASQTIEGAIVEGTQKAKSKVPATLPAVIVRSFSVIPATRELLQNIQSVVHRNTLISFLGPLLILPASSGLLVTMGYSFPAPWIVTMASLPGLTAIIVDTVHMGRQLVAASKKSSTLPKEDTFHEP